MPHSPHGAPPVLVAGLGNPGPRCADTWHNVGLMALEELAERTVPIPSTCYAHERSNAESVQTC